MEKKSKGVPMLRLLVFAVIVILVIMILSGFSKINSQTKEKNSLVEQQKSMTAGNNETRDLLEAGDKEIMEQYARDKLGYGEPGTKIYQNINGD